MTTATAEPVFSDEGGVLPEQPVKRRPGRPKGSKNKPKTTGPTATVTATTAPAKRRGRPKGSKNKPKTDVGPAAVLEDLTPAATATETETVTETATATAPVKRRPGRPKGSKNKPKADTAPAKRGPGRPRKNPEAVTATAPPKRRPGRPKGSKNKPKVTDSTTVTATATAPVKRGPGRPRKNPEATTAPVKRGPGRPRKNAAPVTATKPKAGTRQVLKNPFKTGDSVLIPAGVVFTSSAPTAKGRQVTKRGHSVTVHDFIPARVQPRKSEKGSNILVRPPRLRAKASGGYWKDITLTEKIVTLNGKVPTYETISTGQAAAQATATEPVGLTV